MEKEKRNLSTAEEIKNRKDPLLGGFAKVWDFFRVQNGDDILIVVFQDGSQANMTHEEFGKL